MTYIFYTGILVLLFLLNGCLSNLDINSLESKPLRVLDTVKKRGQLKCGINGNLPGFGIINHLGKAEGFDVDFCKALALSIFADYTQIEYVKANGQQRFDLLSSNEIDVLFRNTTWTLEREFSNNLIFPAINYFDGQAFLIPIRLQHKIKKLEDMNNQKICVQKNTTTESNLLAYVKENALKIETVNVKSPEEVMLALGKGTCSAYTTDASALYIVNALKKGEYKILGPMISKEPLGPAITTGDLNWYRIVQLIVYVFIKAEDLGISSANIDEFKDSEDPKVRQLLGLDSNNNIYNRLGLLDNTGYLIVKNLGNYGELFERNLSGPFQIERGLNNLVSEGGVLYAPSF